jgi:DNA-binding IclR family transcriptional regulator
MASGTMLVIDEVLGQHLVGITQYIGSRLPIYATSTGKAVLAFLDDTRRNAIIEEALQHSQNNDNGNHHTEHTITDRDAFTKILEDVQERGYAYATGELETGLMAVGVPIFDYNGVPQAAISIVGPSIRVKPRTSPAPRYQGDTNRTDSFAQIGLPRPSVTVKTCRDNACIVQINQTIVGASHASPDATPNHNQNIYS